MTDTTHQLIKKTTIRKILKSYQLQLRNFLLTSRFNNETLNENKIWREKHEKVGCIYGSPNLVAKHIPIDAILFILEMNNDTNKITGIGMIQNHSYPYKHRVYKNGNYNRYQYMGKNRIDRSEMTEQEEDIMRFFDHLCFKGKHHMKRGQGLKAFPIEILYKCRKRMDLVDFIGKMFKTRLTN